MVPLTARELSEFTLPTDPPKTVAPLRVKECAPLIVESNVSVVPLNVVSAPSEAAPAYVCPAVVLTLPPLSEAEPLTATDERATLFPTWPANVVLPEVLAVNDSPPAVLPLRVL